MKLAIRTHWRFFDKFSKSLSSGICDSFDIFWQWICEGSRCIFQRFYLGLGCVNTCLGQSWQITLEQTRPRVHYQGWPWPFNHWWWWQCWGQGWHSLFNFNTRHNSCFMNFLNRFLDYVFLDHVVWCTIWHIDGCFFFINHCLLFWEASRARVRILCFKFSLNSLRFFSYLQKKLTQK